MPRSVYAYIVRIKTFGQADTRIKISLKVTFLAIVMQQTGTLKQEGDKT